MSTMLDTIADELREDGDECEVGAWTLRLTIEPDQFMSIMDEQGEGVWCGRLAWAERRNSWDDHYTRPDWADGGAELLRPHFADPIWWRPLDDCLKDRELRDAVRRSVLELLEWGYSVVTVEAFRHRDLYGRPCVEAVGCLGGVDDFDAYPGLVAEIVGDQLWDQLEGVD